MYWIIKDWEIKDFIRQLPKSTSSISWLNKMSDDKLRELWYYKVIWNSLPLEEWHSYWKSSYEIWKEYIIETKEIINEDLKQFKQRKISELKVRYKNEIETEYPDYKQRNVWMWIYSEKENKKIIEFIKLKRDEVNWICSDIEKAKDYKEVISLITKQEEIWV